MIVKSFKKVMNSTYEANGWQREPADVRWMRTCLQRWPLQRGKGILMRLFGPRLRNRNFLMEIEPDIFVPAELNDYMFVWCFMHGYDKDRTHQFSRSLIYPGDTVMDIGANVGFWVMGATRQVGAMGHVHAFEPVPDNYSRLKRNLALNGFDRVHCQQVALADECGHATFFASINGNSGMGSLAKQEGAKHALEVTLTTLDHYCDKHSLRRVDFLKVDVEGAELQVFRGASHLLAMPEAPAIMFEVNKPLAASFGASSSDVIQYLHQYGYSTFRYDGTQLNPVNSEQCREHEDLFAFKPHHLDRYSLLRHYPTV
jgi:FkbM family methyltransferase